MQWMEAGGRQQWETVPEALAFWAMSLGLHFLSLSTKVNSKQSLGIKYSWFEIINA